MRISQQRDLSTELKNIASQHWKKIASYHKKMDMFYQVNHLNVCNMK